MAGRLCLELGIDDPEQWLEDTPKRIVDFWENYYRVEPFGLPWHQTAQTAELLEWIYTMFVARAGQKHDPRKFRDFMPHSFFEERPPLTGNLMSKLEQIARRAERAT